MTARQPTDRAMAEELAAGGNLPGDAHSRPDRHVDAGVTAPPPNGESKAKGLSAGGAFIDLRIWAESLHDAQQNRIALVNRMERGGVDADLLAGHKELLEASEHAFKLAMVRAYRRLVREHMPAVEEWQKSYHGIGEHLLARLLGHLGHPAYAQPYAWMDDKPEGHRCIPERCGKRHLVALEPYPRTLRQLWAYCGHGAPVRRRAGMSQVEAFGLGNARCKMLVHLLAEATIKVKPEPTPLPEAIDRPAQASPAPTTPAKATGESVRDKFYYRRVYDARKEATADRGWTDGHRHADALRIVGKEILRDLWVAARAQSPSGSQRTIGAGGTGGNA